MLSCIESFFNRIANILVFFSGFLLSIAVMLTCLSIFGRGFTSWGLSAIPGDYELVEMLCGLSVFAFMPYCQLHKGHISVDIVMQRFGDNAMRLSQLLGNFVMSCLVFILFYCQLQGTLSKFEYNETSFILEIPIWYPYSIALVFLFIFFLTAIFTVFRNVIELIYGVYGWNVTQNKNQSVVGDMYHE